jgi:hypothetical protein
MEKTKTWIKDGISRNNIEFFVGQKVVVFRRKLNGYPKGLKDGILYHISKIENDCLVVYQSKSNQVSKEYKVHRTYLIPIEYLRNEIINDLLKD